VVAAPRLVQVHAGLGKKKGPERPCLLNFIAGPMLNVNRKSLVGAGDHNAAAGPGDAKNLASIKFSLLTEVGRESAVAIDGTNVLNDTEGIDEVKAVVGKRQSGGSGAKEAVARIPGSSPERRQAGQVNTICIKSALQQRRHRRTHAATNIQDPEACMGIEHAGQISLENRAATMMLRLGVALVRA